MTLCLTSAGPSGAVGTKSGPLGPSEDLGAPQKGLSGQNRALLRPPGAQKGPDIRSKCVLTMSLTQAGQWGVVGIKSGPSGPSEGLGGPQKDISGQKISPFRAPWDPKGVRYQVKVYADHESNSGGPMGGSWD